MIGCCLRSEMEKGEVVMVMVVVVMVVVVVVVEEEVGVSAG